MAGAALALGSAFFLALFLFVAYQRSRSVPGGLKQVPGPRGWPILGNLPQLGRTPHRQLQSWAREYGPMFRLQLGWETHIYVNDAAAVRDIFDRQSAITSSRMPMPVGSDIMSGGKRMLFMGYTKEWRTMRTIVHQLLTPKASAAFMPSQELEGRQLLNDILHDAEKGNDGAAYMHVRRYTTSVIMTSTYGRRVPQWDCDDVRQVYGVLQDFSENLEPGVFIADALPPLARLPRSLQWWRKRAEAAYERQAAVWFRLWYQLNKEIEAGKAPECFVKQLIESQSQKRVIDDEQAAFVAGSMIEAGSETTSATLNTAILILALHPGVQEQARAELDQVVGRGRLPSFADKSNLPYIRAIVTEVLRMRPITSIGTPHYTIKDLEYDGYFIPANTVVTINQYALHFNEERYPNSEKFNPGRYLDNPEMADKSASQVETHIRDHFSFGAGRRFCPGLHLAENSLFITIAMILWAFEIRPPLGSDGIEETVDASDEAYEPGANTIPKPYRMRFLAVSADKAAIVKREWSEASRTVS